MCVISCESGFSSLTFPVSFYLSVSAYGGEKKKGIRVEKTEFDRIWIMSQQLCGRSGFDYMPERNNMPDVPESPRTHTCARSACIQ